MPLIPYKMGDDQDLPRDTTARFARGGPALANPCTPGKRMLQVFLLYDVDTLFGLSVATNSNRQGCKTLLFAISLN